MSFYSFVTLGKSLSFSEPSLISCKMGFFGNFVGTCWGNMCVGKGYIYSGNFYLKTKNIVDLFILVVEKRGSDIVIRSI